MRTAGVGGRSDSGFSILEVLVALTLIVFVVLATGRLIVTTLGLIGRGAGDSSQAARARSEATAWIEATTEYTGRAGFSALIAAAACGGNADCSFWVPAGAPPSGADVPYDRGPALPAGFQCGRVRLQGWGPTPTGSSDPVHPSNLRLITLEIYTSISTCGPGGTGTPFLAAHSGLARTQ